MTWLAVIIGVLCLATMLLYTILRHQSRIARLMADLESREEMRRKLVKPLEAQPQSGFWINCVAHHNVPLTQAEYDKQTQKESYHCPFCGQIPRKIWRKA